MEAEQSPSRQRAQTARAVVLAAATMSLVLVAAVLLSSNAGPSTLEASAEDLVSARAPAPLPGLHACVRAMPVCVVFSRPFLRHIDDFLIAASFPADALAAFFACRLCFGREPYKRRPLN